MIIKLQHLLYPVFVCWIGSVCMATCLKQRHSLDEQNQSKRVKKYCLTKTHHFAIYSLKFYSLERLYSACIHVHACVHVCLCLCMYICSCISIIKFKVLNNCTVCTYTVYVHEYASTKVTLTIIVLQVKKLGPQVVHAANILFNNPNNEVYLYNVHTCTHTYTCTCTCVSIIFSRIC